MVNGLGFTLVWNGGMTNIIVQVSNRSHVFDIQKILDPVIKCNKGLYLRQ